MQKSSEDEIRQRFDKDVERFSNLDTGQQTIMDAPLILDLITDASLYVNPNATQMLDIGCGAGNFTLKMLQKIPSLHCSLLDLSMPMLERARTRVSASTTGTVQIQQANIIKADLPEHHFDIVLAGSVLHHLRSDADWEKVFLKIFKSMKTGASFWISDLVTQESDPLNKLFQKKYVDYLEKLGGPDFRQKVLDYVEQEDSPRSVTYQLDLLRKTGFRFTEILHKNGCFAAFGAIK